MEENTKIETIGTYRTLLDSIDKQIFDLLKVRFEIVNEIGEIKKANNLPILNKEREKQMYATLYESIENKDDYKYYKKVLDAILKTSKEYQK